MRRVWGVVLVAVLAGCGSPAAEPAPSRTVVRVPPQPVETRLGNPETYARVEALTDCAELQREFDQFEAVFGASTAGTERASVAVEYMKFTEERMRTVGC